MIEELRWEHTNDIKRFLDLLNSGNLILGTSDTVIGLYAALTKKGFNALNRVKGRSEKPYLLLIRDHKQALSLCDSHHVLPITDIMHKVWPGPVTLILRAKKSLARYLTSSDGSTIALRVPAHAGLQQALALTRGIFSTSANIAGCPVPDELKNVDPNIRDAVVAIITDDQQIHDKASTILDCTGSTIKVIREGVVSLEKLDLKI